MFNPSQPPGRALCWAFAAFLLVAHFNTSALADIGEALEQGERVWIVGGVSDYISEEESPEFLGGSALKFTRSGEEGTAWIETIVTGPFSIRFWLESIHSFGNGPEYFEFFVNEVLQIEEWDSQGAEYSLQFPEIDLYTLRWQLTDETDPGGGLENAVWLDNVAISHTPVIEGHPASRAIAINGNFSLSVTSFSDSFQTFQWLKDGVPILGENDSILELFNVSKSDSGTYSVGVTNSHGTTHSIEATVLVYDLSFGLAADQPDWPWSFSGSGIWTPTTEVHHDGVDAIAYIPTAGNHAPTIRTTVNGIGTVSFWWKITDSPYHYDLLTFYIDGRRIQQLAGSRAEGTYDWVRVSYDILQSGDHELRWTIDAIQGNLDLIPDPDPLDLPLVYGAWIDELEFSSKPIFINHPIDQVVNEGETISFSVSVASEDTLSYQWRKDGIPINKANDSTLTIDSALPSDAGVYDVVITTDFHELTSSIASAIVISGIGEALDQPDLDWASNNSSSENEGWAPQTETSYDGLSSLQSVLIKSNLSNFVSTVVQGPVTVRYWRKTDLSPEVTMYEIPNYTQSIDWTPVSISFPSEGSHTLRLGHVEGDFWRVPPSAFLGYEWIDKVELDYRPIFTAELRGASIKRGESHTLQVETASSTAVFYQWMREDVDLLGETASSLHFSHISDVDVGNYSVRATNEHGVVHSKEIVIGVYDSLLEAAEMPELDWTFSDPSRWFVQNDTTRDGVDALMIVSDPENPNSLRLSAMIEGPFRLNYWTLTGRALSLGLSSWKLKTITKKEAGSHFVSIDTRVVRGESGNIQYFDQFELSRIPVFEINPQSRLIRRGQAIELKSFAASSLPVSYQWFKNGVEILGARNANYGIANAKGSDAATYSVRATNGDGAAYAEGVILGVSAPISEAFENESLDWNTSVPSSWVVQDKVTFDGSPALEIGKESQWIETSIDGPATVTFFHKGTDSDIFINGIRGRSIEERPEWKSYTFKLFENGPNTVRLRFSGQDDPSWIDGFEISREPIIREYLDSKIVEPGEMIAFSVDAVSGTPMVYQWRKDGVELAGQVESSLTIENAKLSDLGNYDVVLTNDYGSVISLPASAVSSEFINEAIDSVGLEWELSGNGIVALQSENSRDHVDALTFSKEGPYWIQIPDSHVDSLILSTEFEGPATIEYWFMEADTSLGRLRPLVNGIQYDQHQEPKYLITDSYESWIKIEIPIVEPEIHMLDLEFFRFQSNDSKKRMIIDGLAINKAPVITSQLPTLSVMYPEEPFIFEITSESASEVSYQWRKDGVAIDGATARSFTLSEPQESDSGNYDVAVSNANGESISNSSQLVFNGSLQEALDSPNLRYTLEGEGIISFSKSASYDGVDGLRIEVERDEEIVLGTFVSHPKSIEFWWFEDPENCGIAGVDFQQDDDFYQSLVQGERDWNFYSTETVNKRTGELKLRFDSDSRCSSTFYLDSVLVDTSELIANQPTTLFSRIGEHLEIEFDWWDTSGLTFQWMKDGEAIPGATEQTYHIDSFQAIHMGVYELAFSDGSGTKYSDPIDVSNPDLGIADALESEGVSWVLGEQGEWRITDQEAQDGEDSLWLISNSESDLPWIETVIRGPATIEFWWKTAGPDFNDECNEFHFFVNGELSRSIRRNDRWTKESLTITQEGLHTLRWGVPRASCIQTFSAMLDSVSIQQGLVIYSHPESRKIPEGNSALLTTESSSDSSTYQWRRNGIDIIGATGNTYLAQSAGSYDVVVADGVYSQTSDPAIVSLTDPIGHLVEQPDLDWEVSGGLAWYASPGETYDGEDALISPDFPLLPGESRLKTTIEGPANLSFAYLAPGLVINNYIGRFQAYFYLDGKRFGLSTNNGTPLEWDKFYYAIETEGSHVLEWEVTGYFDVPNRLPNRLSLDNMIVESRPLIREQPQASLYFETELISFTVGAISPVAFGPTTYQWYKDGVPILDATDSSYPIPNAQFSDAGDYFVVVSNSAGSSTSDTARIEILEELNDLVGHAGLPYRVKRAIYEFQDELDLTIAGPASLEFDWRGVYLSASGYLMLEVNGKERLTAATDSGWKNERIYLDEGINHVRWTLRGFVANIAVSELPLIETLPPQIYGFDGAKAIISANVNSATPVTVQWLKDGSPLSGAIESILEIEDLGPENIGSYSLEATNVHGTTTSSSIALVVYERPGIAIDYTQLDFAFNGVGSWSTPDSLNASLCSPVLNRGQESSVSTFIEGPVTIGFDVHFGGLNFEFLIDGEVVFSHSTTSFRSSRTVRHAIAQPGEHELTWRLVADPYEDEGASVACIENLEIISDLNSIYSEWAGLLFPVNSPASLIDMQADPDGDTKSNVLEYLLGSDPLTADGPLSIEVVEKDGKFYWESELELIAWVSGIDFTFEGSSDLIDWETIESEFEFSEESETVKLLIRSESFDTLLPMDFMRVKLNYQPSIL